MLNLLNAEFYKLRKSKAVYIGILVASILALLLYGSLVMVSIFVIREFSSGTVKNLVGKGYARPVIFFAKMIPVIVLMLVFEVVVAAVTIGMAVPFMGWEEFSATAWGDVAIYMGACRNIHVGGGAYPQSGGRDFCEHRCSDVFYNAYGRA